FPYTTLFRSVFSVTPAGKEVVLHSFGESGDGANPHGDLLNVNGTLYGTTANGGANGEGTVFTITQSGKEAVLYSFYRRGAGDAGNPYAGPIDVNGTLYGTGSTGGNSDGGAVFSVTRAGKEGVLYSFEGAGDGESPYGGLASVEGTLYGTTSSGGANYCSGFGCRTVFSVTTKVTENVLHSFAGRP